MPPGVPPNIPLGAPGFAVQQVQVWQGQFPPPEAIERYEAINPGTFDRLVTMAERQQQAVIESAAEARRFQRADNQRGQYLGFIVTVLAILGAVICGYLGLPWIAAALVGVPVLSVANALIESAKATPVRRWGSPPVAQDRREQDDQPSLPLE
jgi:uncharacterized membrane protein